MPIQPILPVTHLHDTNHGQPEAAPVDFVAMVEANLIWPHQPDSEEQFRPIRLPELLARPSKPWLIEGLIGPRDIGMIYGPPGSGKTFVVIDLVFAACLGRQFALQFAIDRPLTLAYCAGEGLSGLPARFAAAAAFYGVSDLKSFTFFETVPQLFLQRVDGNRQTVLQFVAEWQARQAANRAPALDLLIIDTLHSATVSADENSAKDMGLVLQLAKMVIGELGCAVLLVHHSNKAGTGERGSSALRGAMDFMIEVKPMAGKFVMTCEKLKDGERWPPHTFALVAKEDSVRVWWDLPAGVEPSAGKQAQDKQAIVHLLQNAPNIRYTARTIGEVIGMGASKQVFKLLKDVVAEHDHIQLGLKDPEKDASPQNPLMYWYQEPRTDADLRPAPDVH